MNKDYAHAEREYRLIHNLPDDFKITKNIPDDFPIERVRLRRMWLIALLFILSTSAYGWTMAFPSLTERPGSISLPLVLQFVIAAASNAIFASNQTLISDLCPGQGASGTAVNNLVRCLLGALGVAFIDRMIASVGVGPAFLGLGLIMSAMSPLLVVEWYWGLSWRVRVSSGPRKEKNMP